MRHVGAALEDVLHERATPIPSSQQRFTVMTAAVPRDNLPVQTTPFVGREPELAEFTALLHDPQVRLVTILAPGGMGKTRLAIEVGRHMTHELPVYFVDLTPLTRADSIIPAIAESTRYAFQPDERDPKQQLLDYLHEKAWLIILDNFEHLIDGATLVSDV
jgi:hypothetical protein